MKIDIFDSKGNKKKHIESKLFEGTIRNDIIQKIAETEKKIQEYAPFEYAGMMTAAHGARHKRHSWKSDRGKGLARIPKKQMSRSGDRFIWVGAFIPGTRGGRRAHPPKLGKRIRKINHKEFILGLKSALAMVSSVDMIKKKYQKLADKKINLNFPLVIEEEALKLNTKQLRGLIEKILGETKEIAFKEKTIRAGKGKMRGRKYKENAGLLFIIGNKENLKMNQIDIIKSSDLKIMDLALNGARVCVFTENAIKDLEIRTGEKNEIKNK